MNERIQRINLLDAKSEPSDFALESIMGAVQKSALAKREQANRILFDRLQNEMKDACASLAEHCLSPAA